MFKELELYLKCCNNFDSISKGSKTFYELSNYKNDMIWNLYHTIIRRLR